MVQSGPGNNKPTCVEECEHAGLNYGSKCVADNRCLCHYGYTGPNAIYIRDPTHEHYKHVVADSCTVPCHYTADYLTNPACADEP